MIYDSLVGRRLDEYRLDSLLGQGGMARVYRGLDVRLKREVAIKVIDKPFRADQDYTRRFEQEAQALAQLEHPHIVRLYRYGEANGLLYMVMQYIEGQRLDQLLAAYRQEGQFIEPEKAARLIREIGAALDYAHGKGVIHRDVKPSNIILNQPGQAILVDFGLALLADIGTRGEALGTPHYIAPEQARSSAYVVPQSDLYALGVILYEMFAGRAPFEAEDPVDVAILHITEPPPSPREFRPDLHPTLEAVMLKALAKEPEERYPNGLALANALDRALKAASPMNSALPPPTLSHLSLPAELRAHPQPPRRGNVSALPPELLETELAQPRPRPYHEGGQAGNGAKVRPQARPVLSGIPAGRPWSIYTIAGLGLLLLLGVFLATLWLTSGLLLPARRDSVNLENPLPTAAPPLETATLANIVQLAADTRRDFSRTPGGAWQYFWSQPDENRFEAMTFEERKYGACWYTKDEEDYVRICPDSGHPGNDADIAWSWTSNFSGRINVVVSARKIDRGGDGVVILAYHNDQAVEGLRLGPDDLQGVADRQLFSADVQAGDRITFVMKRNERVENDHTAFQAQIYRQ